MLASHLALEDTDPYTVLVVEDESMSRRALVCLLRHLGYQTQSAGSAEEALDLLNRSDAPDAALVDLNLPGLDGLEFLQKIDRSHRPKVSVLITATGDERASTRAAEQDVHFLRKPLDVDRLCHILAERMPAPIS